MCNMTNKELDILILNELKSFTLDTFVIKNKVNQTLYKNGSLEKVTTTQVRKRLHTMVGLVVCKKLDSGYLVWSKTL